MRVFLSAFVLAAAPLAFGQASTPDDPLSRAQPIFGDTTSIVPVRHLQLEAGLSYYRRGGAEEERWQFGEALLRYGLRPRLEARVQLPNEIVLRRNGLNGGDNTTVGISAYLGRVFGFDIAAAPGVAFPTGSPSLRDEVVTPIAAFTFQRAQGRGTLSSTLTAAFGRNEGREVVDASATLIDQQPLAPNLNGFVEYFGTFSRLDEPEHVAHFGLQLATSKSTAVDFHFGFGMNEAAPHEFVGAGFAVRF